MPLMPAPPMPTKWMRERSVKLVEHQRAPPSSSRRSAMSADGARGAPATAPPGPCAARRRAVGEQRREPRGEPLGRELVGADHLGAAGLREQPGVVHLVPLGDGERHEQRGAAGGADLGERDRAGPRDQQVARRHGAGHVVEEGDDLDVRGADARPRVGRPRLLQVARAGLVDDAERREARERAAPPPRASPR